MPHIHAISRLEILDALADAVHHARAFAAGDVWQWGLDGIGARAHVSIERVHARRMNANHCLSRPRLGRGEILQLHDIGRSEFVHDDRLHLGFLPCLEFVVANLYEWEFWRLTPALSMRDQ